MTDDVRKWLKDDERSSPYDGDSVATAYTAYAAYRRRCGLLEDRLAAERESNADKSSALGVVCGTLKAEREANAEARATIEQRDAEIAKLCRFIGEHVPGEPSENQGAVDTAIRIIMDLQQGYGRHQLDQLRAVVEAMPEFGRPTRHGNACVVCGGNERGDWGYTERGPDRGHEGGCLLRAALDAAEKGGG